MYQRLLGRGFSLIELLVVISILGVLASLAYPTYSHHILRTHRLDAQLTLLEYRNTLDQHYQSGESDAQTPVLASSEFYDFKLIKRQKHFEITAIPKESQVQDSCGTLVVTHRNERHPAECW